MKQFENWSKFDEVITRTKMCQFLGHPVEQQRTSAWTVWKWHLSAVLKTNILLRCTVKL